MEILAPVGSFEVLESAISAGCDAVYLAGQNFGARAYATNFDSDNLIKAIRYAHSYGVKVHVTVNTLLFEDEIDDAMAFIKFLYENDCDAVIVQDLGLASLIHLNFPDFDMHASTQINAQTLEDVLVLKDLGFKRVIMGRETSLDEIKRIKENIDMEIEVFIHGALCMSYSGNCLFSSFEGGRSGNRGRCAQPCRKEYKFQNKKGYFLSPKDLCTIDEIKEIAKYVDSVKIEGRMKSPSYVYEVVKSYKLALTENTNLDELKYNMKIAFNRGYTKGFVLNVKNNDFTNINKSNHQGVLIGKVKASISGKTSIKLERDLLDGDSIRIVGNNKEDSIIISGMYVDGALVKCAESGQIVVVRNHEEMKENDLVYLTKREYQSFPKKLIPLLLTITNDEKEIKVSFSDEVNIVSASLPYEDANKDYNDRLIEQLKKTGDTIFTVSKVSNNLSKPVYVNIKDLNELRRNLLNELLEKREKRYQRAEVKEIKYPYLDIFVKRDLNKGYSFLVSNSEQLKVVEDCGFKTIYTRFKSDYYYYLPRVGMIKNNPNIVSSNLGSIGDISSIYFNVTNSYTVRVMEYLGYKKIGLSVELSKKDIKKLISGYKERYNEIPHLEVLVYGYIELMYMKHCFINKFYNYDKLHCGKCHGGYLLDNKYQVYGDSLCHLAILSRDPIYLISKIEELKEMGISSFLFSFINEDKKEVKEIIESINEDYSDGYFGHYLKEVL